MRGNHEKHRKCTHIQLLVLFVSVTLNMFRNQDIVVQPCLDRKLAVSSITHLRCDMYVECYTKQNEVC